MATNICGATLSCPRPVPAAVRWLICRSAPSCNLTFVLDQRLRMAELLTTHPAASTLSGRHKCNARMGALKESQFNLKPSYQISIHFQSKETRTRYNYCIDIIFMEKHIFFPIFLECLLRACLPNSTSRRPWWWLLPPNSDIFHVAKQFPRLMQSGIRLEKSVWRVFVCQKENSLSVNVLQMNLNVAAEIFPQRL